MEFDVKQEIWSNIKYTFNEKEQKIEESVLGTFCQFPLRLAWAITVHKSQGSEFPAVILPVADVPARLCYRNLLYTGVTRARKLCVLTGTARTEQTMVENVRQNMRYSGLRYLLKDAATPTEEKQEQLSAT